jgi:hypothetical protein
MAVHWEWPKWYEMMIQFALPVRFKEAPKQWRRPQGPGKSKAEYEQMVAQLKKVREGCYVEPGKVVSLTSLFAVLRHKEDIRMVHTGTKLGLYENFWVPRFPFPMINIHLRVVGGSTFVNNMAIGEMFLNFVLHKSMEVLCGVDLSSFFG